MPPTQALTQQTLPTHFSWDGGACDRTLRTRKSPPRAGNSGLRREARPVLEAEEALLLGRGDEHTVTHERRCGVAVEGIEPEDDQERQY